MNRFSYILWVQDLLDTTSEEYSDRYDPDREVVGLDMYDLPFLLSPSLSRHVPFTDWIRKKQKGLTKISYNRGTGASCIYPLLGCAQRPRWRFIATGSENHPSHQQQKFFLFHRTNTLIGPVRHRRQKHLLRPPKHPSQRPQTPHPSPPHKAPRSTHPPR